MRAKPWLLLVVFVFATPAQASFDVPQLKTALAALTAHDGAGKLGVAVRDLGDGTTLLLEGNRPFPMASVYKLPIAVALLDRVDRGRMSLAKNVHLTQAQRAPGYSPLARAIGPDGLDRTVGQLLEAMIVESDNTACDALLDEVGGPAAVQAVLMLKSVYGVRVDRPEKQLQSDSLGLGRWRNNLHDDQVRERAIAALPVQRRQAAIEAYLRDPRDTATPSGMLDLLTRLAAGQILSAESTEHLLRLMTATVPGAARLKAGLPPEWTLAHRTGSSGMALGIAAATNDVGIVTAPDGRRVAIVTLLSRSKLGGDAREALLAEVARATVAALR
ncbi:MAG: beta-lactamase class [Rhodospirillales bacterium]|nr:beta-lactamase class [Rhodospirillales bacterium]